LYCADGDIFHQEQISELLQCLLDALSHNVSQAKNIGEICAANFVII